MKNIEDLNFFKQDRFRRVSSMFKLEDAMQEVFELMSFKSKIKGLSLKFDQDYFSQGVISSLPSEVIGDK